MAPSKPTPASQPSTPRATRQVLLTDLMPMSPAAANQAAGSNPATPSKKGPQPLAAAPSPSPGRPKGSPSGGKYGRCPRCPVGRRIRSRYNPYGKSLHAGKYRFVCSNRSGGCVYSETLDSDPNLSPAKNFASPSNQAAQDEEEEEDALDSDMDTDNDDGAGAGAGTSSQIEGGPKSKIATPTKTSATPNKTGTAPTNSPLKDKSPQKLGCPECMVGRLVKKIANAFRFKEAVLVCEKVWDGKDMVGGCGYKLELGGEAADDDNDENNGAGDKAKDQQAKNLKRKRAPQDIAREKKELEEWTAKERARAMDDPNAAAVMAGPANMSRKKIVVDLTEDNEALQGTAAAAASSPTSAPRRAQPAATMVSAQAPIVIDDSDEGGAAAGEFEDLGSDDEKELMELADRAAMDELGADEERALMELADKALDMLRAQESEGQLSEGGQECQ